MNKKNYCKDEIYSRCNNYKMTFTTSNNEGKQYHYIVRYSGDRYKDLGCAYTFREYPMNIDQLNLFFMEAKKILRIEKNWSGKRKSCFRYDFS